jgi:hypothetical protein
VVEVEMQQPKLLIIKAFESRLYSGPETVAAAVVNTVVEVEMQQPKLSSKHLKVVFFQGQKRWRLLW